MAITDIDAVSEISTAFLDFSVGARDRVYVKEMIALFTEKICAFFET